MDALTSFRCLLVGGLRPWVTFTLSRVTWSNERLSSTFTFKRGKRRKRENEEGFLISQDMSTKFSLPHMKGCSIWTDIFTTTASAQTLVPACLQSPAYPSWVFTVPVL